MKIKYTLIHKDKNSKARYVLSAEHLQQVLLIDVDMQFPEAWIVHSEITGLIIHGK